MEYVKWQMWMKFSSKLLAQNSRDSYTIRMKDSNWKIAIVQGAMVAGMLMLSSCSSFTPLPGFEIDQMTGEQSRYLQFSPDVRVLVNAPARLDSTLPTRLIMFALPNGNSIEQTFGKTVEEGIDWHFGIQHIGAQTRLIRARDTSTNYIVAYLEAASKSWPSWRQQTPESGKRILALVDTIRGFVPPDARVTLAAHSGGGSLLFGFMNANDAIPFFVERIVFLDANYGYTLADSHASKFLQWLRRSKDNALIVIAYDDREITLNGKKVLSPTGGTFRRTAEMVQHFDSLGIKWNVRQDSLFAFHESTDPNIYFAVHRNALNEILHTVLVEKNGFLEGIGHFLPVADNIGRLWHAVEYRGFIDP